ncbi:OmpP1/FadL family transporter [Zhouia sp. PK063]|uniref:OmpP1/FadL family transporter n=1 Tax=Zhouia sp. PK063 TaxID=3373602 RepID=UPI0037A35925
MKKILFTAAIFVAAYTTNAQTIDDVANIGTTDLQGTARFQALSGAFGALGGDLSAININPAGSAVFNNGYISITAGSYNNYNDANYINTSFNKSANDFQLNQAGALIVFRNNNNNSSIKKFVLGFNYDMINNFHNSYTAIGNSRNSTASYFANYANGYVLDDISAINGETSAQAYNNIMNDVGYNAAQGLLGYETYLINPISDNSSSTEYEPNVTINQPLTHEYRKYTSGYDNKLSLNAATQIGNNFYIGANANVHDIDKTQTTKLDEYGYADNSNIGYTYFENTIRTYGNAISLNIGAIAKLNNTIRIGASYQSPTWYNLTDELQQYVNSDVYNTDTDDYDFVEVNPNTITQFPDYKITIPSKVTGSIAMVFGQSGLISFDYSYQDMSNAKLGPKSDLTFQSENQYISSRLKAVNTYRIGGEYRLKNLSLRGGYRIEESPYKFDSSTANAIEMGDLNGYSFGLGYTFKATHIDLTFAQSKRDYNYPLYNTGLTDRPNIETTKSNILLSVGFDL